MILLGVAVYYIGTLRSDVSDLRKDLQAAGAAGQTAVPQPSATAPAGPSAPAAVDAGDHIRGSRSAQVYLVEYADLECPYCKIQHATLRQIVEDYGGQVAWVYRHLPLSFHANAQKEAEASECAASTGGNEKFWEYIDAIMERTTSNGTGFPLNGLEPLAAEIGLNPATFSDCLNSGSEAPRVKEDALSGVRANVTRTPSTYIVSADGLTVHLVVGAVPIDQMKTAIDAVLKK